MSWKSDQYALGVVLFEMLTGQRPFAGQRVAEIIAKHLFQKPPRADEVEPRVSRGAADVVATMLAKDPERRFASYDELIVSLEAA